MSATLQTPGADGTSELSDLDLIGEGGLEFDDDLTIRREFAPRAPAKVTVDIADTDATWKWSSKKADAAGCRVGLDLPALDGEAGLAWNRDDVEKTQEVFPLQPSNQEVIALLKPKRRTPSVRPVESTAQLIAMVTPPPSKMRFVWPVAICLVAMFSAMFVTRLSRTSQAIIGEARAATVHAPVAMLAAPAEKTGTLITTLDGKGQRVFVDGKIAFEGGQSFVVDCGKHIVRVGNGKSHEVDVPCGAELAVSP